LSYPYFYYPPFPALADPFNMILTWMYLWFYWTSMMYYIEIFRAMTGAWRKIMEDTFTQSARPSVA